MAGICCELMEYWFGFLYL